MAEIYARRIALEDIADFHKVLSEVISEKHFLLKAKTPVYVGVENFVKESIRTDSAHFVAVDESKILGWCSVTPLSFADQGHVGQLEMGVLKPSRKQGVGQLLIDETLKHCQKKGLEIIYVETLEQNELAVSLLKKNSFQILGIKKNFKKSEDKYSNVVMLAKSI